MPIRVGTIVSINNAYNDYQKRIEYLKRKREVAKDLKETQQINNDIRMIESEVTEFLQLILPDPEPSKSSPYLAKEFDSLYKDSSNTLDIEG